MKIILLGLLSLISWSVVADDWSYAANKYTASVKLRSVTIVRPTGEVFIEQILPFANYESLTERGTLEWHGNIAGDGNKVKIAGYMGDGKYPQAIEVNGTMEFSNEKINVNLTYTVKKAMPTMWYLAALRFKMNNNLIGKGVRWGNKEEKIIPKNWSQASQVSSDSADGLIVNQIKFDFDSAFRERFCDLRAEKKSGFILDIYPKSRRGIDPWVVAAGNVYKFTGQIVFKE